MRLHLLAFGKLKTSGLREAADYYLKQVQSFVSVQEIELKTVAVSSKAPSDRLRIQELEAAILMRRLETILGSRGSFYLLDESGKSLSTASWASLVRAWESEGTPDLAFCIGGSLGFSPKLKENARGLLSLGPQTLSHELARVVLMEQIYRAWSVTRNHPYHN